MTAVLTRPTDTTEPADNYGTTIPCNVLRDALTACLLSVSKETTLPILRTVRVVKTGSELVFTSTDRYRLTRVTVTLTDDDSLDFDILLDRDDIPRILTLAPKGVKFAVNYVWLIVAGGTLTVRDLDGSEIKVVEQLGKLVQNETQLARTEMAEKITQAGIGIAYLAGAAAPFSHSRLAGRTTQNLCT